MAVSFIIIYYYRHWIFGLEILGISALGMMLAGKFRLDRSLITGSLILLVLMVTCSWIIAGGQWRKVQILFKFLYPAAFFLILVLMPITERPIRPFLYFFPTLIIGKCFYQLVYYRLPHTEAHRLTYFGNPIVYGQVLAMACLLLLVLIRYERNIFRLAAAGVGLLIGLTGLFFSYARGAWLGFIAAALWFMGSHLKSRLIRVLAACLIIFGVGAFVVEPALASRIASIFSLTAITNAQRLVIWETSWKIFATAPVVGVGFHRFAPHFQQLSHNPLIPFSNHAHNNLLQILAEFGGLGLVIWLFVVVAIIIRIVKNKRTTTDPLRLCLAQTLIAWLISLFVHGFTDYTLGMRIPLTLFMMMLGLFAASENTLESSEDVSVTIRRPNSLLNFFRVNHTQ